MRISDRYIGKQVLFGTLLAVMVLSLVLVLGSLFKEIRPLLVDRQAPLLLLLSFVFNAWLVSLMFSVPWGFLSAVLLVIGRMSAAQEITGFRVAGVSLPRLVAPVFVVAALCSGFCLWLNVNVVPRAKAPVRQLLYEQALRDPRSLLSPGLTDDFSNVKFYIEDQDGDSLLGLHLYRMRPGAQPDEPPQVYLHAGRFTFIVDEEQKQLRLKLYDASFRTFRPDGSFDMFSAEEAEPYLIPFSAMFYRTIKPSAMTNGEIKTYLAEHPEMIAPVRVRFEGVVQQRFSFSMACLAFSFIAVPLGMQSRRRESSSGLLLSLLLAGAYFLFSIVADEVKTGTQATIALWAPNVLCVLIGLWLFKRARFK